jgi:hypothetical protein
MATKPAAHIQAIASNPPPCLVVRPYANGTTRTQVIPPSNVIVAAVPWRLLFSRRMARGSGYAVVVVAWPMQASDELIKRIKTMNFFI